MLRLETLVLERGGVEGCDVGEAGERSGVAAAEDGVGGEDVFEGGKVFFVEEKIEEGEELGDGELGGCGVGGVEDWGGGK